MRNIQKLYKVHFPDISHSSFSLKTCLRLFSLIKYERNAIERTIIAFLRLEILLSELLHLLNVDISSSQKFFLRKANNLKPKTRQFDCSN